MKITKANSMDIVWLAIFCPAVGLGTYFTPGWAFSLGACLFPILAYVLGLKTGDIVSQNRDEQLRP